MDNADLPFPQRVVAKIIESRIAEELERIPVNLPPLLDQMHCGAREQLLSTLNSLAKPMLPPAERARGIALGMIYAAKKRNELSGAATDELLDHVLNLTLQEI